MKQTKYQISVISDVICPWCYIGKNRLDIALKKLRPNYDISVSWRAFELNPRLPLKGINRDLYLEQKFGSKSSAESIYGNIKSVALEDNLDINFELIKKTPNTRMSHRLVTATESTSKQNLLVDALFKSYFVLGENIGDKEVLLAIAKRLDLPDEVSQSIDNDHSINSLVISQEKHAETLGVSGVPAFIYDDMLLFTGAQSSETIYFSLKRAIEKSC